MPSGNCSFMVSSLSSCLAHLLPCGWFTLVFALATCASLHPLMVIEHRLLHPHLIFIYLTSTMTVFPKAILSSGGHRLRLSVWRAQFNPMHRVCAGNSSFILPTLLDPPSYQPNLSLYHPIFCPWFSNASLHYTMCLPFLAILGTFEHEVVKDVLIKGLRSVGVLVTMK